MAPSVYTNAAPLTPLRVLLVDDRADDARLIKGPA